MKISIITVCKNPGKALKRTVESVIFQTYKEIEHIIIDGDSTDGTAQYLKDLKSQDLSSNVWVAGLKFLSEPDSGIYNAMNKGIRLSSGDFILFLNAGDYLASQNVIYEVTEKIKENSSEGDIYFGNIISEDPHTGQKYMVPGRMRNIDPIKLFFWSVPHPAAFIQREFLKNTGGYDESFKISGDRELFLRAYHLEHADIFYIPVTVSVFMTDGISSNREGRRLLKQEDLSIIKKYYGSFGGLMYNFKLLLVIMRFLYKGWLKIEEKY